MTKRMILPLLFGLIGCAILVSLGTWQVKRLAWKEAILSEIDARITAPAVALPESIDPDVDVYLPVQAQGTFGDDRIRVLVSQKKVGAGYRIISPFTTNGRTIMVDRGVIPIADELPTSPTGSVEVTGNLHWPNEVDSYTPDPDTNRDIWFARDVEQMAAKLGTDPVLLILRSATPATPEILPLPVSRFGIPNDHLSYAITWFSLATIWFVMTGILLWRIRQRTV
ncbi:SURF1 family protein [uncultured Litoreibacter sp.]|uniref:SURF1 family protein n=1 Tax=uncultured Litoreibacter sp. TaxID=1392394 RepID=UPI00260E5C1A|nr:SURF1 family protein [uncultured Litoreibacter sp.]